MERDRSAKIIAIVALFVGVMGLTIGFSTFTSQLRISSSAQVTPDEGDFSVKFSKKSDGVETGNVAGVTAPTGVANFTADEASLVEEKITGLRANFTAPGQTVTYSFYAFNDGEYDAFLKSVAYENVAGGSTTKVCRATGTGEAAATDAYVQAACEAINVSVKVGSATYNGSVSGITTHQLSKNTGEEVVVTITYAADGARADGDFEVVFGDIGLTYNSAD